jgi:hypothetical protein
MNVIGKLRGRLTERCNEDKWPPEVVSCFATVASLKEMQACQGKLNEDQRTKLLSEIRQVMMGARGDSRMPPGLGGHPPMLGSPGPGAPGGDTAGSAPAAAGSAAAPAPTGSAAPSPAGGSN